MTRTLEDLHAALSDLQIAYGQEILRITRRLKALLRKGS